MFIYFINFTISAKDSFVKFKKKKKEQILLTEKYQISSFNEWMIKIRLKLWNDILGNDKSEKQ